MERMAEVVPDSDDQVLQHFLSNSSWDERGVMDQVALEADELLGGREDSALLIDETAFTKKGGKSVGVARQWNGRLGKVDNCQVGVFGALCSGSASTLIDTRLYLPQKWVKDKARCRAAKIPLESRRFRSKVDLALEMVQASRRLGVRFQWVIADGGYGKEPRFLRTLVVQALVVVLSVELGFTQRWLDNTPLTGGQWAACLLLASSILVVSEVRKALARRGSHDDPAAVIVEPELVPA